MTTGLRARLGTVEMPVSVANRRSRHMSTPQEDLFRREYTWRQSKTRKNGGFQVLRSPDSDLQDPPGSAHLTDTSSTPVLGPELSRKWLQCLRSAWSQMLLRPWWGWRWKRRSQSLVTGPEACRPRLGCRGAQNWPGFYAFCGYKSGRRQAQLL